MTEALLRSLAPEVLGALARRFGGWESCEDAVQEALFAAATQWPRDGPPANPKGWLITAAARRRIETIRSDAARARREERDFAERAAVAAPAQAADDTLTLFVLCCHPALRAPSQIALTLRAVGGLTTSEIARAFLVPEATVAQRISRAKQRIRATGAQFRLPPEDELPERMAAVLHVLYLVFNEGYTASSGRSLHRVELSSEAIRLARQVLALRPDDGEAAGLLALMLLTDARRPARTTADGALVPLAEQDRSRWDTSMIAEGRALVADALEHARVGPYQVQAAIAALHDEAEQAKDTDWAQIATLYALLSALAPGPMVTLNRIVARAMVDGAGSGLTQLAAVEHDPALAGHHRVHAVRAHLLELAGDPDAACRQYRLAAQRTRSLPEQRYLDARATRLERR